MSAAVLLAVALALCVGAAVTLQPPLNALLAARLGAPTYAAFVSFAVGALVLFLVNLAVAPRAGTPSIKTMAETPLILWLAGGALGAFFVTSSLWAAPRIGLVAWFALVIAAQLTAALAIDHFGFVGMETRPVTLLRCLGALLAASGAALVLWRS